MMIDWWIDGVLAAALVVLAWSSLGTANLFKAVVMFVVLGLFLALAWVRLGAVDVAMAEAAIGAGVTGALLLDAVGQMQDEPAETPDV